MGECSEDVMEYGQDLCTDTDCSSNNAIVSNFSSTEPCLEDRINNNVIIGTGEEIVQNKSSEFDLCGQPSYFEPQFHLIEQPIIYYVNT